MRQIGRALYLASRSYIRRFLGSIQHLKYIGMKQLKHSDLNIQNLIRTEVSVVQSGHDYIDKNWNPSGVTAQFIEDADTYHARYFDRLDFEELTRRMLLLAEVPSSAGLRVLDIGSGGGSSVFAALKLLPDSHVVASDISPQLLEKLVHYAFSKDELKNRVSAFCFDLHVPFFEKNCFDLVIGCAILHHLTNPFKALKNVVYALKKGGKIVLCEPLEAGNLINLFIYDEMIKIEREFGDPSDQRLTQLMTAMRRDIQARQGPPDEKPWTQLLDDKWIFDSSYLAVLAAQLECESVKVWPAQEDLRHVFETTFKSLLVESGNATLRLSESALQLLRDVDAGISVELKKKMCPTGIIVITK